VTGEKGNMGMATRGDKGNGVMHEENGRRLKSAGNARRVTRERCLEKGRHAKGAGNMKKSDV